MGRPDMGSKWIIAEVSRADLAGLYRLCRMLNSASSTSVMARACDVLPARGHMTGTDEASGVAWSVPDDRALICFPFTGGLVGGSHISALKLIQNLDRSRFEPLIVLHDDKGPVRDFLNEHQVPFEPAPCPMYMAPGDMLGRQAIRTPGAILTLARFLRRRRVRIVHTNDGPMHVTWGLARGSPRFRNSGITGVILARGARAS